MQGSRSGAVVATAWATMLYFGQDGYVDMAKRLHVGTVALCDAVKSTPGLKVAQNTHSFTFIVFTFAPARCRAGCVHGGVHQRRLQHLWLHGQAAQEGVCDIV